MGGVPWRNNLGQHRTSHFAQERAGTNDASFECDSRPGITNPSMDSNVKTKGAGKEAAQVQAQSPACSLPPTPPTPVSPGLRTFALTTTSSKMLCSCVSIGTIEPRAPGVPVKARVSPSIREEWCQGVEPQEGSPTFSVASFRGPQLNRARPEARKGPVRCRYNPSRYL